MATEIENIVETEFEDEPAQQSSKGGSATLPYIIGNQAFVKLGAFGVLANLQVYLTTVFYMQPVNSALLMTCFNGCGGVATFLGAWVSDAFLGRFKTMTITSVCFVLGMIAVTLTAVLPQLHPPKCETTSGERCMGAIGWQYGFLITGFVLIVVGDAGIGPCSLPFAIDQFDQKTRSGKKMVDWLFKWYFFCNNIALITATTVFVILQTKLGWTIGMSIPCSFVVMSFILFLCGSRRYIKVAPKGSPVSTILQVLVAAFKKRKFPLPQNPASTLFDYIPEAAATSKLQYTLKLSCLAKGAIITRQDQIKDDGSAAKKWQLCSIHQVEEVKCVVKVLPVLLSSILFGLTMSQSFSFVIYQGMQSDRRIGIFKVPAGIIPVVAVVVGTVWNPVFNWVLQKLGYKELPILRKMAIGIVLSIIAMIISGLVERMRRNMTHTNPTEQTSGSISDMSVLWLIPQLVVEGMGDSLYVLAQIQFYYLELPKSMKSFSGSFLGVGNAIANMFNALIIAIIRHATHKANGSNWLSQDLSKGKLDGFYYIGAAVGAVHLAYFLVLQRWFENGGSNNGGGANV